MRANHPRDRLASARNKRTNVQSKYRESGLDWLVWFPWE